MADDDRSRRELGTALGVGGLPPALLEQALSHASYVREAGRGHEESNQRLEFLGDAILDAVIAEELYRRFPLMAEGWLTRAKAAVVRTTNLSRVARHLALGPHLLLGKGEENSGGRRKTSVLADALEALVGAIYLALGWSAVRDFVRAHFLDVINEVEDQSLRDAKTSLQEFCQRLAQTTPEYCTVRSSGPAHAPVFGVEVQFDGRVIGRGEGRSKQEAEQVAARAALVNQAEWASPAQSD